jgi:hypothetical protein
MNGGATTINHQPDMLLVSQTPVEETPFCNITNNGQTSGDTYFSRH